MTETEIDDEVDTTEIATQTQTAQEEEEFDLEDSTPNQLQVQPDQPTDEAQTGNTSTVVAERTLWQQSPIQISLHLLPVDDQPGGRPVMLGLRVAQGAPVIHQLREVDLGRLPFFVADQLARLETGMTSQKPGQSDKASAVAPKPAPSAIGKPSSNARSGNPPAPKPQPVAPEQMDLFDW